MYDEASRPLGIPGSNSKVLGLVLGDSVWVPLVPLVLGVSVKSVP